MYKIKKYDVLFNKIVMYFLLLSMSLFLSTDSFPIIEICLAIICAYILMFCISRKMKPIIDFVKSPFFIWYIVFWLFTVIITAINNFQDLAVILKTIVVFSVYIFGFGILYNDKETKKIVNITNMMELVGVILSVWILVFEFQNLIQGQRIGYSVMVGNPNSAGVLLSTYMFFIVYKVTQTKDKKDILALILCFIVILATGSKKAIIVAIISFVLFLFKNGNLVKKRLLYFLIVFVVGIVACLSIPGLYDNIGRRFLSMFGEIGIINFHSDYSSEMRMDYTQKAIEMWQENVMFGGGYGNFASNSGYGTYSHNNYTELLSSVGIIGAALYYSYYVFLLIKNWMKRKNDMKFIMYILFIVSIFISDIGAVTFYMYPIYYIVLVIITFDLDIHLKREEINGEQEDS